jgi:hypothetical protein
MMHSLVVQFHLEEDGNADAAVRIFLRASTRFAMSASFLVCVEDTAYPLPFSPSPSVPVRRISTVFGVGNMKSLFDSKHGKIQSLAFISGPMLTMT